MINLKDKNLKILIGCILFREFTGSEMYVYELAKNLVAKGHDVTVLSPYINGQLSILAQTRGIKVRSFSNAPVNEKFDIIHCQHQPVVTEVMRVFANIPVICTIHSEIIDLENPVISENIKSSSCKILP